MEIPSKLNRGKDQQKNVMWGNQERNDNLKNVNINFMKG